MMALRLLVPVLLLTLAAANGVTPIEKVINLLAGMKSDVLSDGAAEAKAYGKYACFCKDTTKAKSDSIKTGSDRIESESADIADKTQSQKSDSTDLSKRRANQEELSAKLQATNTRCAKEKAEYEAEAADLNKAISSLKNALKSMEGGKPGAALIQDSAAHQDLLETLAMADAMNMVAVPKRKAVTSMIQSSSSVDPADPDYQYHSKEILDLLKDLDKDFRAEKKDLDTEYNKAKKSCDEMKLSLKQEMSSNTDAMKALDRNIQMLAKEIAEHRENLVEAEGDLQDDEQYLKDLTAQCEARANDYDQRANMRKSEVTALSQALQILRGDVKGAADAVNQRALIQKLVSKPEAVPVAVDKTDKKPKATVQAAQAVKKPISFLQASAGVSIEERKDRALSLLSNEGQRLGSFVLTALAQRSAADPFMKIKGLIQKLIERLVAEATAEATKKGFCDTELGKARKDRDFRREESLDLSAELEGLEAKRDALTEEITLLTGQIKSETLALKTATQDRKEEKEDNLKTLSTAKDGLSAVNDALLTLKVFYSQAAKAAFIQASPVDEDTSGPGFSGNYQGNQSASKAVLSLLETIVSDFERTISTTEASEEAAHREFVEFSQATQSSIASKTTKKELDEQDLKTTQTSLKTSMDNLETAQKLLDDALMELEDLKPACIDTGMSYAERTQKRKEEMAALEKALCILDTDKVEAACMLA